MKKILLFAALCSAMMACTNKGTIANEVVTDSIAVDSLDSLVVDTVANDTL